MLAPGVFFIALPMGTSVAALQRIFPNQVRGQVSALFLFFLNLGGQTLGPLGPGLLNDRLFHNEGMIGPSMAITIGAAAVLMVVVFLATLRPYRADYESMHAARNQSETRPSGSSRVTPETPLIAQTAQPGSRAVVPARARARSRRW